jgi:hypothetical protein
MAKISLAKLDVPALLKLRDDVSTALTRRAHELEGQLARLGAKTWAEGAEEADE